MSFRYLLDTNILSETLKPQPNLQVLNSIKINRLAITTSAITMQEIIFGYSCLPVSKKDNKLKTMLRKYNKPFRFYRTTMMRECGMALKEQD